MKKIVALCALFVAACGTQQETDTEDPVETATPAPTSTSTPAPSGQPNLRVLSWSVTKAALPSSDVYEPNDTTSTAMYLGGSGYIYDLTEGYIDPVHAEVTAEVENAGNADSAAFDADVWIDATPSTGSRGAITLPVSSLAAGAKTSLAFTVKSEQVGKTVKAIMKADAAAVIAESDENDNVSDDVNVVLPGRDEDWFSFDEASGRAVKVRLINLPGDYDLELYAPNGTRVAYSSAVGTANELINYNTTTSGRYRVRVYGFQGASDEVQPYRLEITVP